MGTWREDWPARVDSWREPAILSLVLAGAVAIPLAFVRDPADLFRLPKAVLFRAEAILLASVVLAAALLGASLPRSKRRDPWVILPLMAFAILALLTLTSTNLSLSLSALTTAAATLVIFLATVAARRGGGMLVAAPLAAAFVNAILLLVEESGLWMPFGVQPGVTHHLQCSALVGNPNEVGAYLGAATLACIAAITAGMPGRRWSPRNIAVAIVLGAGLVASQSLTAAAAFIAGAFFMVAISSWKKALAAAATAAVIGAILVALVAPLRSRAANVVRWTRSGQYNALFTERFTPFVAAWLMFVDHPLTGTGPGTFPWQYYDYKILAEQRYPSLRGAYNRGVNFGEVHNDHLQVMAEEGLVGYGLAAALIGALACLSFTIPASALDWPRRFARRMALPLAVFWVVLSIAQFPLETTVVRSLLIHLAALCAGWRNS